MLTACFSGFGGYTDDVCGIITNPLLQAGVYTAEGSMANPSNEEATIARGVNTAIKTCTEQKLIDKGINPYAPPPTIVQNIMPPTPWYQDWKLLGVIGLVVVGGIVVARR